MGKPRLYCGLDASPDGKFLLVSWLERPFSYTVPCGRFPKRLQLWDRCAAASSSRMLVHVRNHRGLSAQHMQISPAASRLHGLAAACLPCKGCQSGGMHV